MPGSCGKVRYLPAPTISPRLPGRMIVICAPDAGRRSGGNAAPAATRASSPTRRTRRTTCVADSCLQRPPQRNRHPDPLGSVGRPDLLDAEHSLGLAHNQWHSVRRLGLEVANAAAVRHMVSARLGPAGRPEGGSFRPCWPPRRPSSAAGIWPEPTKRGLKTAPGRPRWQRHNFSAHSPDRPTVPSASRQYTSLTTANRNEPR